MGVAAPSAASATFAGSGNPVPGKTRRHKKHHRKHHAKRDKGKKDKRHAHRGTSAERHPSKGKNAKRRANKNRGAGK